MSEMRRRLIGKRTPDKYIRFKDPVVAKICAEKWGDGIGLTLEQAAAVTDIGTTFQGNTEITSFDEFELFINVKSLGSDGDPSDAPFLRCINLKSITLPPNLASIGYQSFDGCTNLVFDVLDLGKINKPLGYVCFRGVQIFTLKNIWNCFNAQLMAFNGNNLITKLNVPKGVKRLWNFGGCKNLKEINRLPVSIDTIKTLFTATQVGIDIELPNLKSCTAIVGGSSIPIVNTPIRRIINLGKITSLGDYATPWELDIIVFPYTIKTIGAAMAGRTLDVAIFYPISPPTIHKVQAYYGRRLFFVPDESLEAYKTADNWNAWSSRIFPISDYVKFDDITIYMQNNVVYNTALGVYEKFDPTPISRFGTKSMIYNVSGYDTLKIAGNGGSDSRLYCFLDENNEVITTADELLVANPLYISIPTMAKKMVVCCEESQVDVKVEIGKQIQL